MKNRLEIYGTSSVGVERKNKRIVVPANLRKVFGKQVLLWIPKEEDMPKDVKNSKQKIIALMVDKVDVIRERLYTGNNFLDDVFTNLYERKIKDNKLCLPKDVKDELDEKSEVLFIGCGEYVALVKKAVEELIKEE